MKSIYLTLALANCGSSLVPIGFRNCDKLRTRVSSISRAQSSPTFAERAHLFGEDDPNHKQTILQTITHRRLEDVVLAKGLVSVDSLKAQAAEFEAQYGPPLDLKARVASAAAGPRGMGLAAEFKRASPSKGDIAVHLDAAEQGLKYADVGAAVISVLTEEHWFKGTLEDMRAVRVATQEAALNADGGAKHERPAVLRKDFLVDVYQVLEARAFGADTVLLIVAILEVSQLRELIAACRAVGMEPLVEVHTDQELDIALACDAKVIGVNNRNLHTFKLDLETTERHARRAATLATPEQKQPMILALSGIASSSDVDRYRSLGVQGVLVGEALMRAADPRQAIEDLLGVGDSGGGGVVERALVKVCGITDPDAALAACRAGASLIGVIFAPKSKRKVTAAQAAAVVATVRSFGERDGPKRPTADASSSSGSVAERLVAGAAALRSASSRTPLVVGVFQDQAPEEVKRLAIESGVDLVQFHGDESDGDVSIVGLPAIRVLHLPPNNADGSMSSQARAGALATNLEAGGAPAPHVLAVLLDTATSSVSGGERGGTGLAFDWQTAFELGASHGIPALVAGGLTPSTVGALTGASGLGGPLLLGVDASSALEVEGRPGTKDIEKLTSFVSAAISKSD